jgi:hypothetical protein
MIGKLIGSALSFLGAALCGYGVYSLANMLYLGLTNQNWLMAIAGGLLVYLFGGLLAIGFLGFAILGIIVLSE